MKMGIQQRAAFVSSTLVFVLCLANLEALAGARASAFSHSEVKWKKPSELTPSFLAQNDKPILMLIRKTWSGACTVLSEELQHTEESKAFVELSRNYVMVDAADADEPLDDMYSPDGRYIPRILFLDADGNVRKEHTCMLNLNPAYQYFYSSAAQVVHSMTAVWEAYSTQHVSGSAASSAA
eukprot:jgi/Mesen1/8742/ME000052S08167